MIGNIGFIAVIILLSVIASFSVTGMFIVMRRCEGAEDRISTLEAQVQILEANLMSHLHDESKKTATFPQTYSLMRYSESDWEKKRRRRWQ